MRIIKFLILLFVCTNVLAQPKTITVYFEGKQPNPQLNVIMKYHKEIGATGQQFGIQIQNLTGNKLEVSGNYFANLVNGNVKDKKFTIVIKPNATVGGNGIFTDVDIAETVFPEDCKALNNTRIKSVGFSIYNVVDITEKENKKKSDAEQKSKQEVDRINQNEKDRQELIERNLQINNQQNEELKQRQEIQQKIDIIQKDYERKQKNIEVVGNIVTTGLETIFAISEKKRQREENERELRALRAKQEKLEEELKQKQKAETIKQNEELRENEFKKQITIDSAIVLEINIFEKTNNIKNKIDSVFFIGYKRDYNKSELLPLTIKTFVVFRYSDGTYPLFSSILEKSKFTNTSSDYGISYLLGFFISQSAAFKAIADIETNANEFGIKTVIDKKIKKINSLSNTSSKDDSFWNQ